MFMQKLSGWTMETKLHLLLQHKIVFTNHQLHCNYSLTLQCIAKMFITTF